MSCRVLLLALLLTVVLHSTHATAPKVRNRGKSTVTAPPKPSGTPTPTAPPAQKPSPTLNAKPSTIPSLPAPCNPFTDSTCRFNMTYTGLPITFPAAKTWAGYERMDGLNVIDPSASASRYVPQWTLIPLGDQKYTILDGRGWILTSGCTPNGQGVSLWEPDAKKYLELIPGTRNRAAVSCYSPTWKLEKLPNNAWLIESVQEDGGGCLSITYAINEKVVGTGGNFDCPENSGWTIIPA